MENKNGKIEHERISVDLKDFLIILWKKSGIILLTMVIFGAAAFVLGKRQETVKYSSETKILIQGNGDIESCVQLIKSQYVLEHAAEKLSASFDLDLSDLKNNVSVFQTEADRMIEISALASGPEEAEETVRTIRDIAIDRINELMDDEVYEFTNSDNEKTVIKLGKIADIGLLEIIEDVSEPSVVKSVNIVKNVLIFAILGFILQSGFWAVKYLMHEVTCPIRRPEDVYRYLGEEVLAAIPVRKDHAQKLIGVNGKENNITLNIGENDPRSKEAFRFLRTNLTALSGTGKVFGFTGTKGRDGTSSVAFYTAKTLADMDKKVLYIDADLHKAVHGQKSNFPGLCELIGGEAEYAEAVLKTEYNNLWMICVGDTKKASEEMFNKASFKNVLKQSKEKYDYVIVDTPPMRSYVDSAIIGMECDGMVYVIKSDAVSCKLAKILKEQMERMGGRIIGTVLTQADMKHDCYYGRYYYSYQEKEPGRMKFN